MYSVSQAYLTKLKSEDTKVRRIRGYVDDVQFDENDILGDTFNFVDMCVKSSEIKLGGVFIGTLHLTFLQSFVDRFPRGSWQGRVITCSVGLLVGYDDNNEEIWEDVPIKPYIIDTPDRSSLGLDIVAYDVMHKFDKPFPATQTTGEIYDYALNACTECGVELGMTKAQMQALPNGTETLGLYPESDIETYRDVLSWVAVAVGGFATINREGKLVFRTWHLTPDIEIGIDDRFDGGKWSDFVTSYTAISVDDMESGAKEYYSVEEDTGLTLDIGACPLIQYGLPETKTRQRTNILNAVQNLKYTPFSSESLIDPALDLGDVIFYPNGIPNGAVGCVMRLDFSYHKGAKVKGYGKNPAQSGARNANDKALTQAMSKTSENEVVTHTFVNVSPYQLDDDVMVSIFRIRFTTIKPKVVTIAGEINLDLDITAASGIATATAYYYLNGVLEEYQPIDSWDNDGMHLLHLFNFLKDLPAGTTYELRIYLKIKGGSAFIDMSHARAMLQGQGLVAVERFDGIIEIEDEFVPIEPHVDIVSITDSATITMQQPERIEIVDTFVPIAIPNMVVEITDTPRLTATAVQYRRITEDGNTRVTEDGSERVTEV